MTKPSARPRRLGGVHPPFRLLPFASALLIAACSASPGASIPPSAAASAPTIASPSANLGSVPAANPADYSGILSMDEIEGGCTYLQADDGRKLQVIYPAGWELRKSPLELIAPDGSVHSKGGDRVSVNGSEAHDIATICQIGPVIQASEVLPH
ncbi:MAG: hypothetical protein ACJ771_07930 [Chloroflexota bacterium]